MAYSEKEIEKIFNTICTEIQNGKALRNILKEKDMPSTSTFYEWLDLYDTKAKQYARACEIRADAIFDEIIDIADETSKDTIVTEKGEIPNNEWISRSRLKVDARKWIASKLNPKKYGEKIQQEHSGEITTNVISLGSGIKPNDINN